MYRYTASDKGYTVGRVCLIKGGLIELGIETQLFESEYYPLSLVALNENKIIAFSRRVDYGYALICTIDDMSISVVNSNSNVTGSFSSYNKIYIEVLDENQILMLNGDSCSIYTINTDNTITRSNSITLDINVSKSCLIKVEENKMCVIASKYNREEQNYSGLYAYIVNIKNQNITSTVGTNLLSITQSSEIYSSGIALGDNKIFVMYSGSSYYGLVCTINENTITAGTQKLIVGISSRRRA